MDDKARFSTLSYSLEEAVLLLVFVVLFLSLCWQHYRPPRQSLNLNPPPEEVIPGVGEFNGELLPISKYRKEEANGQALDNECSVCLQAFMEGEDVRQLPECKHSFHAACIDMWLYSHSSCPLCRADVAVLRPPGCLTPDAEESQDELPV